MKRSRFTEEPIIGFLKQRESGVTTTLSAAMPSLQPLLRTYVASENA